MRFLHWLGHELKALLAATLYFLACFLAIMTLKTLLLAQYGIAFSGLTTALVGALVTAKVVIVLDNVQPGFLRRLPQAADVALRTAAYTLATLLLLLVEHAFEIRGESGGFGPAVASVFEHRDTHKVWATVIGVGLAFLGYNAFAVLRRAFGARRIMGAFFARPEAGG